MTRTRGRFLTYDYDRMLVMFTMTDGQTNVPCAISTEAMDVLDRSRGSKSSAEREAQFMKLRDQIEDCAARKYLEAGREGTPPGLILRTVDVATR
jgi:hypothetical protein